MARDFDFKKFVRKKRDWYNGVRSVYCPILGENISFSSKGFYHLKYRGDGNKRTIKEYVYKLHLLEFAPIVIEKAKQISSRIITNAKGKAITYSAFEYFIPKAKLIIRVIARRTGMGKHTFHSIMGIKQGKRKPPRM